MTKTFALAVGTALLGLIAFAPPVLSQNKSSCQAENAKYCKNVKSGQGRRYRCLRGHSSKLSQACRSRLRATLKAQCGADAKKLCPKSGRQTPSCLRKNRARVSPKCKNFV